MPFFVNEDRQHHHNHSSSLRCNIWSDMLFVYELTFHCYTPLWCNSWASNINVSEWEGERQIVQKKWHLTHITIKLNYNPFIRENRETNAHEPTTCAFVFIQFTFVVCCAHQLIGIFAHLFTRFFFIYASTGIFGHYCVIERNGLRMSMMKMVHSARDTKISIQDNECCLALGDEKRMSKKPFLVSTHVVTLTRRENFRFFRRVCSF